LLASLLVGRGELLEKGIEGGGGLAAIERCKGLGGDPRLGQAYASGDAFGGEIALMTFDCGQCIVLRPAL
jgi:hypothetical protein